MVEYFRRNSPGRVAAAGVTLVELALVLAVLVLVLRLGLPAMGAVYDAIMLRTRLDDFASDLQLTRSIALQRNGRAVMCKGSDRVCQSSGGWQQGWFVFHDANGNGIRESDEEVLSEHEPLPALVALGQQQCRRLHFLHGARHEPAAGREQLPGRDNRPVPRGGRTCDRGPQTGHQFFGKTAHRERERVQLPLSTFSAGLRPPAS